MPLECKRFEWWRIFFHEYNRFDYLEQIEKKTYNQLFRLFELTKSKPPHLQYSPILNIFMTPQPQPPFSLPMESI